MIFRMEINILINIHKDSHKNFYRYKTIFTV